MVLAKDESRDDEFYSNSANKQLLRDIEAISRALYLPKTTQKALLLSPTDIQSESSQDLHLLENRLIQRSKNNNEHVLNKGKKSSSSLWNWKRPLKALSHIRYRKFSCSFFLHVHSIEGLPPNFDDVSLCMEFRRKDEVLKTRPSRVSKGTADFDDTLMHSCTVYCQKNGMQDSCKYEPKIFLVYASIAGEGVDIGRHWIDLTRLLPLTFEDLERQKSSGKWTTSFKLAGKAKGATLTISFGFSLMANSSYEPSGNITVSELINLAYRRPSTRQRGIRSGQNDAGGKLSRSGSVPSDLNNGSLLSSRSYETETCHHVSVNPILELSKSINFLCDKLEEGNLNSSSSSQPVPKNLTPSTHKLDLNLEPVGASKVDESDDMDFVVIDRGVEVLERGEKNLVQDCIDSRDSSWIETINVDQILIDDDIAHEKRIACKSIEVGTWEKENTRDENINEVHSTCTNMPAMEELNLAQNLLFLESTELDPSLAAGDGSYLEAQSNYEANETVRRSLSLDNLSESIASDFLNMLADEHGFNELDSISEPESPRERLLREFEKEALVSGNFILDFDPTEEFVGSFCGASSVSDPMDGSGDLFDASVLHDAEEDCQRESLYIRRRRKAKMIEDVENEALMREWGLDEKAFQSTPRFHSTGFGSPIELPSEDSVELPSLGEGFGPFIQTKGGGLLRTMSPLLFRNAKTDVSLVMQVSTAVVLRAELGSTNTEVLSRLVFLGVEKLSMQIDKVMPMEDITGRTLQQIASEVVNACCNAPPCCETTMNEEDFFGRRWELEENAFGGSCKDFKIDLDFVLLSDILLLAAQKVEALSIEGLRIQSGMSNEEAPSSIYPSCNVSPLEGKNTNFQDLSWEQEAAFQSHNARDAGITADDLLGLSISLDEWLKLDARSVALGNKLTVTFRLQLRDPLRNYEAVGDPMLVLVHVERNFVPSAASRRRTNGQRSDLSAQNERANLTNDEMESEKEELISYFTIKEVHVAGLNTNFGRTSGVIPKQKQMGTRWLLASGQGKRNSHPLLDSRTLVKVSPLVHAYAQRKNILWSISCSREDLEGPIAHVRNPNIIFPDERIS